MMAVSSVAVAFVGTLALGVAAAMEWRQQAEMEEEARLLVEAMLNRRPGNILGDSFMSFRYVDHVDTLDVDENAPDGQAVGG